MAFPIILANCTTPLLGLADTAVIGHVGSVADLGAIALGSLLFSFIFWGFGFLRMSTSGFVAQAGGRGDAVEVVAVPLRGLLLGFGIGTALIALQWPLAQAALAVFSAGSDVEAITRTFFAYRIWGAPASLSLYVLMGLFIGRGQSRALLLAQVVLNGLNIALDILFAGVLGLGVRGIGLGTALAEWLTLGLAGALAWHLLQPEIRASRAQLLSALRDRQRMRAMLGANADIMIRTLLLLAGFGLFTNQGARFGDAVLAANHVLLELISFSAFFLDGFAFATEALVGRALGANSREIFRQVVRRSTALAALTACGLAGALLTAGRLVVDQLTTLAPVRNLAHQYLPFMAGYVLVSFAAFQLDGIFIGATRTRALRNAALVSTAAFAAALVLLAPAFGNTGLWSAFIVFVLARAAALLAHYPGAFGAARFREPA